MWDTSALLVRPASTISTTSMVSSSVTRRPSTNRDAFPSRSSMRVISGPPPCTRTGWMPAPLRSTRSSASGPSRPESSTLPPNLTTTVFPFQALTYRSPWAITPPCSVTASTESLGEVPGIFLHVLLREIAGPHGGFPAPQTQVDHHLHILA